MGKENWGIAPKSLNFGEGDRNLPYKSFGDTSGPKHWGFAVENSPGTAYFRGGTRVPVSEILSTLVQKNSKVGLSLEF